VFNWTDCPSILSGSTLLFLDPHHSWSRGFDPPGGPEYDFPVSATDEAMMNQLHCFSLINTEWQRPFRGTIIRIPLRNALQAEKSGISTRETTTDDIERSLNSFAEEMGSDGLLFLNSVQRIVLSIDDKQLNDIEVTNGHDLTR
jgi:sacsin